MSVENYTRKYIFPVQFCLGMIGNTLNLFVLNAPGMRTKTNCFLSAMAIADLCFFCSLFPVYVNEFFTDNNNYKWFYYYSLVPLSALANCFSAASIWLTVGVTLERVIAIRFPLLAKTYWKKSRIVLAIILIYASSFILSCYQIAWRKPKPLPLNSALVPKNHDYLYVNDTSEPLMFWYVHISHLLFGTVVIAIPLFVITILNSVLIYHLRANRRSLRNFRRTVRIKRSERKATFLVVILIIVFIVVYVPSGIIAVWDAAATIGRLKKPKRYADMVEVCNCLVCTGKALNFILYCSASSNFREKLVRLFRSKNPCKSTGHSRRQSSANNPSLSVEDALVRDTTITDSGSSPYFTRNRRRSTDWNLRKHIRSPRPLDRISQEKKRTISADTLALYMGNVKTQCSYGALSHRTHSSESIDDV